MMALIVLALAAAPEPPTCQKAAVIELFRLVANGTGSIEDRARLVADQEENEWAMVGCRMFPGLGETDDTTPAQDEAIYNAMILKPRQHKSEILAYLKHVAPRAFAAPISGSQVSKPRILPDQDSVEYTVMTNAGAIRVGFEPTSCKILYLALPNGHSMLGDMDCRWRQKENDCRAKENDAPNVLKHSKRTPQR